MKMTPPTGRWLALVAACAALAVAPPRNVFAIPNQIGGFFNLAGMNFEDFAALPETWKQGAKLKASWELWKSPDVTDTAIELQRLTVPATIFGLPASEVTVQRINDLALRFDAVFVPARGTPLARLEQSVRRNLDAWAESSESDHFVSGATRIALTPRPATGDIVVTFTPAAPAAVTAR